MNNIPSRFIQAVELIISKSEVPGRKMQVKNRRALADLISVYPSTISDIERGRMPTVEQIHDICQKAGVNPTFIILGEGPIFIEGQHNSIDEKLNIIIKKLSQKK